MAKKKDLTPDVLGTGMLAKIARKIKGRQYKTENVKKNTLKTNKKDKSKARKPKKEAYQKTTEEGLEELRKLRAKQRSRSAKNS